ncbi:MAG: DUF4838 domain-containing protein, partial [Planctomycetota bacterium]
MMVIKKKTALCLVLAILTASLLQAAETLQLAAEKKTDYVIVKPVNPTTVDTWAAEQLALYLKIAEAATENQKAVCVGLSKGTAKALGAEPLKDLKEQESVSKSIAGNVYLYGAGKHGNMYAVKNFLEMLGWRWYSMHEKPVVPKKENLAVESFNIKKGFSFKYRDITSWYSADFYYWNGRNMGLETKRLRRAGKRDIEPSPYVSESILYPAIHSFLRFIPPKPGDSDLPGFTDVGYFKDHPEYFSLWTTGKRVANKQLCLSSPELRKVYTDNVIKHIKRYGDDLIIAIDANDCPYEFCYCPGCQALSRLYKSPGGPLYDFLLDFAPMMEKRYPNVMFKIIAYRRDQTQIPPVLPEGRKFTDNIMLEFAPIEDSTMVEWAHPQQNKTYQDLLAWAKLVKHLRVFYYPMTWGWGAIMPMGTISRTVTDMRMMKKAGVDGLFFDHATDANWVGTNFAHLHTYVI